MMSKRLEKRLAPKDGKPARKCKVLAQVVVPDKAGFALVPGQEYDLDGYIAEGIQLKDVVNDDWFEEAEQPAEAAEVNEE